MDSDQRLKQVLICDDDEISRQSLAHKVAQIGYEVVGVATTGIEAMNLYLEKNPHVVLLDINMPLGSGLTVLSLIRDISSSTIVVMVTGDQLHYTPETVIKTLEIGANDYLIKGKFDIERLQLAIKNNKADHGDVKTVNKEELKEMFDFDSTS